MHIIKSVGVLSVAKIIGLMYACLGLIFAPLFLLIGVLASAAGQHNNPLAGIFSFGFAVLFPVIYGVIGFIAGAIGALLYNLFARWAGGFELQMELRPQTLTAPYPVIPPASPASNS
jgi:H+/Cl- antiporter ClcA